MSTRAIPERLLLTVGPLHAPGILPEPHPFETIAPWREGFVERDGVRSWYAQYGTSGPWLAFAPIYQIANSHLLKGVVPYLSEHFRVVVMDLRGNGRSDRPTSPDAYSFEHYFADFVAVLDRLQVERTALVGLSATAMTVLRLAAEQPARVSHLVISGGFTGRLLNDPAVAVAVRADMQAMRDDWPAYLDHFFGTLCFPEPHSTKPLEDAVLHGGWATDSSTVAMAFAGWLDNDLREHARQVRCPTLVIHGDIDGRVPYASGEAMAALVPGARMLTVGGGGHVMLARDPAAFCIAVRDFAGPGPARSTWVRAMARKRKALFISSAIGLGHVQRDLAIAREMRKLQPDLQIDWFTVDPAATYLEREGERLHPITQRLANESRHFEAKAIRRARPAGLLRAAHHGRADGAQLHDLRRPDGVGALRHRDRRRVLGGGLPLPREPGTQAPALRLPHRLRRLPADGRGQPARGLPVCRPQRRRHRTRGALPVDPRSRDLRRQPRGRARRCLSAEGLPNIRDWTKRNFAFTGYALPFDPKSLADTEKLRARHGYRPDEKLAIAAIGGTARGRASAAQDRPGLPGDEAPGARAAFAAHRRHRGWRARLSLSTRAWKCGPTCTTCSNTWPALTWRWCRAG